ncbi:class I SAM-dependent methyltransferase [Nakamurella leprariae]|uniref:Class I SAM-dependent methyltransferase n=1 Tax=Nakamurella leprariae TaxID=2803911 RepID=A0A938YGL9_9ACTN|nr:class I SAM-dependent methyltransferase [Nakamurella leprariae]MBM9469146.1 class I SAM-dependent methyltransferase [Nakamurella leprariae]
MSTDLADPATGAPPPDHHTADHHAHAHHQHGPALTLADRHAHEAETYDAMAAGLLADWSDEAYRIDPAVIPFANREHVDYLTAAIDEIRPLAGKRILEVGAGSGSLAVWLALQGAEVVGIDVSGGILEVARRRAEVSGVADRVTFVHSPIESFDPAAAGLAIEQFDAIIGNNVVHHFDRDLAMAALGRMLAPGAVAVFCEPVLFVPDWLRRLRNSAPVTRRFPPHTHSPDERSLDKGDLALMQRWFRLVQWRPFQLLSRLQNFTELSDPVWHRLESIDRWVLRTVPSTRNVCRMVVVTLGLPREVPTR